MKGFHRVIVNAIGVMLATRLVAYPALGQVTWTISGTIKDAKTGESLVGATVLAKSGGISRGVAANAYGFYSISLPPDSYTLTAQFIGYTARQIPLTLQTNKTLNIDLSDQSVALTEVQVKASREDDPITRNQLGVEKLNIESIKPIPVLFGERDILKTLQLLPGVKSAGEGNSGFFVRGGAADQNLILLDEATVYNASHLLGFFSVFNSDALKDATLYKRGIPARYGGRLSSVLDIRMKEGNNQKFSITGGIGVIASRLTVEGPLGLHHNKTGANQPARGNPARGSFIVSGRRTYADLLLKGASDSTIKQSQLYFYDLNAKANDKLNDKNWLYASAYFGTDVLGYGSLFGIEWGNATATFRWNHLFSPLTGTIGHTYTLRVALGGAVYQATSTMPALVPLDALTYEAQALGDIVYANYTDPAMAGNYYRWVMYVNDKQQGDVFVVNDRLNNGIRTRQALFLTSSNAPHLTTGDRIRVEMQCIDAPVYDYFFGLAQVLGSGNNQVATPANPTSNLSGGALGYFSAYSGTTNNLTIK